MAEHEADKPLALLLPAPFEGLQCQAEPPALAGRLVDEMQGGVEGSTTPSSLSAAQLARLHQLLHEARFQPPDGAHLSPAGAALL